MIKETIIPVGSELIFKNKSTMEKSIKRNVGIWFTGSIKSLEVITDKLGDIFKILTEAKDYKKNFKNKLSLIKKHTNWTMPEKTIAEQLGSGKIKKYETESSLSKKQSLKF